MLASRWPCCIQRFSGHLAPVSIFERRRKDVRTSQHSQSAQVEFQFGIIAQYRQIYIQYSVKLTFTVPCYLEHTGLIVGFIKCSDICDTCNIYMTLDGDVRLSATHIYHQSHHTCVRRCSLGPPELDIHSTLLTGKRLPTRTRVEARTACKPKRLKRLVYEG